MRIELPFKAMTFNSLWAAPAGAFAITVVITVVYDLKFKRSGMALLLLRDGLIKNFGADGRDTYVRWIGP